MGRPPIGKKSENNGAVKVRVSYVRHPEKSGYVNRLNRLRFIAIGQKSIRERFWRIYSFVDCVVCCPVFFLFIVSRRLFVTVDSTISKLIDSCFVLSLLLSCFSVTSNVYSIDRTRETLTTCRSAVNTFGGRQSVHGPSSTFENISCSRATFVSLFWLVSTERENELCYLSEPPLQSIS